MRIVTAGSIREAYEEVLAAALDEKFLKGDDPSAVVGDFMEQATNVLSSMRDMYNSRASDRESIVKPVLGMLGKLATLVADAEETLKQHQDNGDPEDDNRSIDES